MKSRTIKCIAMPLMAVLLAFAACKKEVAKQEEQESDQLNKESEAATLSTIQKEAESGTLANGAVIVTNSAASGGKYVDLKGGSLSFSINITTEEMFNIYVRAAAPGGEKTNYFSIDGEQTSFTVPQSSTYQDYKVAGYIRLRTGSHTLAILKSYGYINIDYIKLVGTSGRTYSIKPTLSNAASSTATKSLYSWMVQQFGTKTISGQTQGDAEFAYIKNLTGKTPLLKGFDMQKYSPRYSYSWDDACGCHTFGPKLNAGVTEEAIAWYNNNAKKPIIQFQWHWHSPMGGSAGTNTFYTEFTNFDVSKAVTPGTAEYTATIRDIDAIAVQLKKLRDAGVPILWRPLHELGGTWFWWSAKGPGPFKALWNILYDRLTNYHQLNNLIWVWNGTRADWYVGNDKLDIASTDQYADPYTYPTFRDDYDKIYAATGGTKIIGLSENGALPNLSEAYFQGVNWAFFMTWHSRLTSANSDAQIKAIYSNPKVITLENR